MKAVLDQIGFGGEELKNVKECFVAGIMDGEEYDGSKWIQLSFYNPGTKKYVNLQFDSDGNMFITDPFE